VCEKSLFREFLAIVAPAATIMAEGDRCRVVYREHSVFASGTLPQPVEVAIENRVWVDRYVPKEAIRRL
jgi:hypothetical protein